MRKAFRRLNAPLKSAPRLSEEVFMDSMRRIALAAVAALAVAAPLATASEAAPSTSRYSTLSNRTTYTRWAYTNLTLKVRKSPLGRSRSIGRLHFNTEDGPPEIYLALRLYTDAHGNDWVQTQLPGRPNGRTGWVPREALGEFHLIHTQLVVNRKTLRATLYKNGR